MTEWDRRRVLAATALAGLAAAPARAAMGGLIDIHQHIVAPNAPEAVREIMAAWSVEGALAGMDAAGIATAIGWPGPILAPDLARRQPIARAYNEFGATLAQTHPGRFGLFASLPFPLVDACAAEIDYALDHLAADGFGIATSYGTRWLGDQSFWPIYEQLEARGAVLFVHPIDTAAYAPEALTYLQPPMDATWIEWPMNTARTILSLMASGALRRFPRIRFVFCHGGGVMPLLVNRIQGLAAWDHVGEAGLARVFPDGIGAAFKRLNFDCAQACSATNMGALRSLAADANILFGSDYPFFAPTYAAGAFHGLDLPGAAQMAIGRDNAGRLLPRWA